MKWRLAVLCLLLAALSGCGWIQNEYRVVSEHPAPVPTASAQEEEIYSATDVNSLTDVVLSLVRDGSAQNRIDVTNFRGDIKQSVSGIMRRLALEPVYAYAVDYADYDVIEQDDAVILKLDMVYRRSAEEIASIVEVQDVDRAQQLIDRALNNFDVAITLKIEQYSDTDFASKACQHCLEQPCRVVEIPKVTVEVYPEIGTTRIVEMHFGYNNNRDDMRAMLGNVSTVCASAGTYASAVRGDLQRLTRLCEYLITRSDYQQTDTTTTPAYGLLCRKQAGNKGFASVLYNTAERSELECYLVTGTREDAPYCWNIVAVDGKYYHIDLMQQWQTGQITPQLYSDAQMTGYAWDAAAYPVCDTQPEPDASQAPESEPTESDPSDNN